MLRKKIGQLLMVGYQGLTPSDEFLRFVEEWQIGGVIVFARNIEDPEKLPSAIKRIQEAAGRKIFTAIDQEGGLVMRILTKGSLFHSNMGLAATDDCKLIEQSYKAIGKEMCSLGLNWNLAPVLDINHFENPGIGARSFGDSPEAVEKYGIPAIKGLKNSGVMSCAKHFPGKGRARVDSHLTLPVIDISKQELLNTELAPFQAAVDFGVDAIMTAHVFFPAFERQADLPATLSKSVLTDLLRKKMAFDGLIVTDDLEMGAITEAYGIADAAARSFAAGADILLICHQLKQQIAAANTILKLVEQDSFYQNRLEESLARINQKKESLPEKNYENILTLQQQHEPLINDIHKKSIKVLRFDKEMLNLQNDEEILVVFPEITSLVQVEENQKNDRFDQIILTEFPSAKLIKYNPQEKGQTIKERIKAQNFNSANHKLIFFSYNAHLFAEQKNIALELAAQTSNAAIVALRNPYDLIDTPDFSTAIATFSFRSPAILAAISLFKGTIKPASDNWPIDIKNW
ncbi:MAG: beta-N-acetylhexosaminidase [Candidatus Rifleibacteriota bacterium]